MTKVINFKTTQKALIKEIQSRHNRELNDVLILITKELGVYEENKDKPRKYNIDLIKGTLEKIVIPKDSKEPKA